MQNAFLIAASLFGLTAVALGAFGAHGLKSLISREYLGMWEKGAQYQIYHSLALFMCYLFLRKEQSTAIRNAALCFIGGILFFSGSLYLLATHEVTNIPVALLGPLTPIGGFFFIAGWGMVFVQALKQK